MEVLLDAMAERGIEIDYDTEEYFIITLARPESTRKEVTLQVILLTYKAVFLILSQRNKTHRLS